MVLIKYKDVPMNANIRVKYVSGVSSYRTPYGSNFRCQKCSCEYFYGEKELSRTAESSMTGVTDQIARFVVTCNDCCHGSSLLVYRNESEVGGIFLYWRKLCHIFASIMQHLRSRTLKG